jgi:hypothetical protein
MFISSGNPPPQKVSSAALSGNANNHIRLEEEDGPGTGGSATVLADTILEWDTISGELRRITIPQSPTAPVIVSVTLLLATYMVNDASFASILPNIHF